jgi:release factor glutamine methyltransferase
MAEAGASTPLATGAPTPPAAWAPADIGVSAADVDELEVHMPRQAIALMRVVPTLLFPTGQAFHVGETVKVTRRRPSRQRPLRARVASRLAEAGCVAPLDEADELIEAAATDEGLLDRLVERRVTGEPLAWVTGSVLFAGHRICVHTGVYVPRWQSEPLARRAVELLPDDGLAADLCTGSGAIAVALARARPTARVLATDVDPDACACARDNGVEVFTGHLASPLLASHRGRFDVVIAVVPYVPTDQLVYLPRDVREHEPLLALDGGPHGTRVLEQAVWAGAELLRPGGALLLELGGDQAEALSGALTAAGFAPARLFEDDDGDVRGIEARKSSG